MIGLMESDKIKETKNILMPLFEAEPAVAFVYLFGSQATGKAGPMSDYDFAVFFDEEDTKKRHEILFRLGGAINKALGSDAIDIHCLNDLYAPELKFNIIHDGVLLFERGGLRLIIEPRILNEYFDFTYLLRKYGLTKQVA